MKKQAQPVTAEQFEVDMIKGTNDKDRQSGLGAELDRAYDTIAALRRQIKNAELAAAVDRKAAAAKRKKQKHRRAVVTLIAVLAAAIAALLSSWDVTSYWVTVGVIQVCLITTCVCFALEIASAKG